MNFTFLLTLSCIPWSFIQNKQSLLTRKIMFYVVEYNFTISSWLWIHEMHWEINTLVNLSILLLPDMKTNAVNIFHATQIKSNQINTLTMDQLVNALWAIHKAHTLSSTVCAFHVRLHSETSSARPMLFYSTNYWHQFWVQFVV